MTQQQLADAADLSVQAVAQWERGIREPGWSSIVALCKALEVSCDEFMQPPAEREPPKPGRPRKAEPESPAEVKPKGKSEKKGKG